MMYIQCIRKLFVYIYLPPPSPQSTHPEKITCVNTYMDAPLAKKMFISSFLQSLSYASPQALLNLLFPQQTLPSTAPYNGDNERLDAFKRFIADAERRAVPIPDFPPNSDWLNVSRPLSDTDLRGRLLILDFWTYCCINCMHILPDLAYIENKYKDKPVTVIGVHSAKFDNEQDSEAIRSAVLRYGVLFFCITNYTYISSRRESLYVLVIFLFPPPLFFHIIHCYDIPCRHSPSCRQ